MQLHPLLDTSGWRCPVSRGGREERDDGEWRHLFFCCQLERTITIPCLDVRLDEYDRNFLRKEGINSPATNILRSPIEGLQQLET